MKYLSHKKQLEKDKREMMIALYKKHGSTVEDISKFFGCHKSYVTKVLRGQYD